MKVYYGGRILTMVGETKETVKYVEAVVEKDGTIAFTGTLAEATKRFPKAILENLQGKTLMPGHIDPHLHPSMAALILRMDFITPFDWVLPSGKYEGVRSHVKYVERLKQLISKHQSKEYLITWGYHQLFHGEVNRPLLDQLAPSIPVVVWHRSFHEVYLNSVALNQLDHQEELKANSQVDWVNGHFYEMGLDAIFATNFSSHVFPLMQDGYADLVKVVHHSGITAVGDLEFPLIDINMEKEQAAKNLKSRDTYFSTYCVGSGRNFLVSAKGDHNLALKQIQEVAKSFSDDQVIVYDNHVKALCDGAFFSLAMQMKDGYPDPGHEGQWIMPPDELEDMMKVYWNAGFQIHIHTNGDLGMETVLNIVTKLNFSKPRKNHRTTIEHAGYFTKDQAQRIADLGLLVSAAPYYFPTLADKYSSEDVGLGADRAHAISPLSWLFDKGVTTALHSDFTMAPAQPLVLAWCAVNRITYEGNCFREDLKITPYQGMLAITKNAAIILGTDDIMGTIEKGKLANFTILEKDPLVVDGSAIKDIKVCGSVYKGRKHDI